MYWLKMGNVTYSNQTLLHSDLAENKLTSGPHTYYEVSRNLSCMC